MSVFYTYKGYFLCSLPPKTPCCPSEKAWSTAVGSQTCSLPNLYLLSIYVGYTWPYLSSCK